MLYNLKSAGFNEPEAQLHYEVFGNVTEYPPGWKSITETEFARSVFFMYSPTKIETRTMCHKTDSEGTLRVRSQEGTLFYMPNGTGIAIVGNWQEGKIQYYSFGCQHVMRELTKDECTEKAIPHFGLSYHIDECTACGYRHSRDSSD